MRTSGTVIPPNVPSRRWVITWNDPGLLDELLVGETWDDSLLLEGGDHRSSRAVNENGDVDVLSRSLRPVECDCLRAEQVPLRVEPLHRRCDRGQRQLRSCVGSTRRSAARAPGARRGLLLAYGHQAIPGSATGHCVSVHPRAAESPPRRHPSRGPPTPRDEAVREAPSRDRQRL